MKHAIFSQSYKDGDDAVTCWWGISGEAMTFLVIDATGEPFTKAAFKMATGDNGRCGVLECADGIRCIDVAGTVVYLAKDCVGGTKLPMSASELTSYLGGGKYPLSLTGVKSYLNDCGA